MLKLQDFSLDEYRALLGRVRDGRACLRFGDFAPPGGGPLRLRDGKAPPERFVILRHDVDFSPACALRLAQQEAELGFPATYFFLLTSDLYNLLGRPHRDVPRQIVELGHEVGLHYDVPVLAEDPSPREALVRQTALLAELSGQPVRSMAMHNPAWNGADPFRDDGEFINAYDPAFTKDIAYYSDSCGAWLDATHATLTSGEIPPRLQLLIHPVYWNHGTGDRRSRLAEWAKQHGGYAEHFLRELEKLWPTHKGVIEHDRRTGKI
ncbi:MAG: hypothetical protein JW849_04015 [Phycisphaerae bacterium]|nr:hypothetical protein [Phycisphaerae bacterium]